MIQTQVFKIVGSVDLSMGIASLPHEPPTQLQYVLLNESYYFTQESHTTLFREDPVCVVVIRTGGTMMIMLLLLRAIPIE